MTKQSQVFWGAFAWFSHLACFQCPLMLYRVWMYYFIFNYILFYWLWGLHRPWHISWGCQMATFGSQFPSFTIWAPGTKLKSRLAPNAFTCWVISLALCSPKKKWCPMFEIAPLVTAPWLAGGRLDGSTALALWVTLLWMFVHIFWVALLSDQMNVRITLEAAYHPKADDKAPLLTTPLISLP